MRKGKPEELIRKSLHKIALAVALALITYGVYSVSSLLPLPISVGLVYNLIMAFIAIYVGWVIYRMGRGLCANRSAVQLGGFVDSLDAGTLLTILMGVILLVGLNTINPTNSFPTAEATEAPFKLMTTLERSSFALGETVTITIKLVNVGNDPVNVTFLTRSPPTWLAFRIYNALNTLVYETPMGAWPALTNVTLNPEDYITQTHKWNPKTTGIYKVIGFVSSIGFIDNTPTPSFTMETPPIEIIIN